MNKKVWILVPLIAGLLLTGLVTALATPALAAQPMPQSPMISSQSYQLNWDAVSSGGSTMQGATFTMYSTTGQNVVSTMTGSTYTMKNGFWHGVFENIRKVFLPIITKG